MFGRYRGAPFNLKSTSALCLPEGLGDGARHQNYVLKTYIFYPLKKVRHTLHSMPQLKLPTFDTKMQGYYILLPFILHENRYDGNYFTTSFSAVLTTNSPFSTSKMIFCPLSIVPFNNSSESRSSTFF